MEVVKEDNDVIKISDKNEISFNKSIALSKVFLICLLISFLFLMVCSANSFLYAFNDNQDTNWYITMGNGMLAGKAPYKDLFEQKGPIVYYLFAIICSFGNPYINVFILEVICVSLFLFFSYKIMIKFTSQFRSIIGIVILCLIYTTSSFFVVGGGAVEEFCAPIFAWFLLVFFEYIFDKKDISFKRAFIIGILLAILFLTKFTLVIMPAIILLIWFIVKLRQRDVKRTFLSVLFMLISFISIFLLSLIYYFIKGAISDLFKVYFYDNLFLYKTDLNITYNLNLIFVECFVGIAFVIFGFVIYIYKYNRKAINFAILVLSYFIILLFSGNFSYYFQPLLVFSSVGVAYLIEYISKIKFNFIFRKLSLILTIVICFALCFPFGNVTNELTWQKDDYIHFQIAEDIADYGIENPSLFCYKMWDYGFYNVTGIIPSEKYFANNLFDEDNFPEMYTAFYEAIEQKRNDFVLVRVENYEEDKEFLDQFYQIYKEYSYRYYKDTSNSYNFTVYLMIPI